MNYSRILVYLLVLTMGLIAGCARSTVVYFDSPAGAKLAVENLRFTVPIQVRFRQPALGSTTYALYLTIPTEHEFLSVKGEMIIYAYKTQDPDLEGLNFSDCSISPHDLDLLEKNIPVTLTGYTELGGQLAYKLLLTRQNK